MILLLLSALVLTTSAAGNGLPPFMLLSPPSFRSGQQTTLNMVFFNDNRGNMTVTYTNTTRKWHPTSVVSTDVISETNISITKRHVQIHVQVPDKIVGTHQMKFSGKMEEFGDFEINWRSLSVRSTGFKSYVQTDKPIYKPGQPVRFRSFSVDSELKGLMLPGMEVIIINPRGITLFEETITSEESPIHQGVFLLAEEADIGSYRIIVSGKSFAECEFTVEEYVLPKFGVKIEAPAHISSDATYVEGKVSATYTYGKPVNGKLLMKFGVDIKEQSMYSGPYHFHEMTMDLVEGNADWKVDITDLTKKKLKYLFNPWCSPSNLVITANITDEARGFQVEKTHSDTKFAQSSFTLSFNKNTQKNYVTGFPYYVELDVKAITKNKVNGHKVKLTMISGLTVLKYAEKEIMVKDGKVFAMFDVPEDACALKITADMDIDSACDAVFACFQPERMVSKADEYIRFVKNETKTYNSGESVNYKIYSNKAVEMLQFVVLSKGNIVKSWNINPVWVINESGKQQIEGSFDIPNDLNIRSRLIVLSANERTGFILADAIDLCMVEELKNSVDIQFDKQSAKPGETIRLYMTSDPKSFIGVSVSDASLNLLRQPCKILTKEATISFLRGLDNGKSKDLSCKRHDPYQCKSSTKVKIIDIRDLLNSEGLKITTNMNMFNYVTPVDETDRRSYYAEERFYGSYGRNGPTYAMAKSSDSLSENSSESPVNMIMDSVEDDEPEQSAPRLRNVFPESWLWTEVLSDDNGKQTLSVVAPDTITGWVGNAFGLSPEKGLGFSNEIKFQTFLPFFISLDLPYSGTVGERITVPIRVFNYLETGITAKVKITSGMFEEKEESVAVAANKATTVNYTISLTEAGNHAIKVEAFSSQKESDAVEKKLYVKPGGEKIVESWSMLIMEKKKSSDKTVMHVKLPSNYIPGSHTLKLVAVGDILGEAVSGISNLIQLPSGCGEQNMHKIAINVFSANYLKSLYNKLPENIEYNIKHNLNVGLQQQFAYRKGSSQSSQGYSIFKGAETSDWLSAFVHKITSQFPMDIHLPCETGINSDRDYLLKLIPYTSSYNFTKNVERKGWSPYQYSYHKQKDIYWNAYYIISLLEGEGSNRCGKSFNSSSYYSSKLGKACNATAFAYRDVGDCCYHHMVSYAINLCEKHDLLDRKDFRKPYDDTTCLGRSTDKRFMFATCQKDLKHPSVRGSSKSIEATGYAALYLMSKNQIKESLPLIMWLAGQRNEHGGFRSSQDTVIGLQALSKFAELSNADMSGKTDMTIAIGKGRSYFEKITIKDKNKLTVKEVVLTPTTGNYKIKYNGVGVAFVQLISTYHITSKEYEPLFDLQVETGFTDNVNTLKIKFSLPSEKSRSTMYLMELAAVTGTVFTTALVEGQIQRPYSGFDIISRYDIKEGGQKLQLYIDPMALVIDFTLLVPLESKFKVDNRVPAQVSLIDYYEPSQRETIFYNLTESDNSVSESVSDENCGLSLSCDILKSHDVIVVGFPDKIKNNEVNVKGIQILKKCKGAEFLDNKRMTTAAFANKANKSCIKPMTKKKSIFLMSYRADKSVQVEGVSDYESALPKVKECFSEIKYCPNN